MQSARTSSTLACCYHVAHGTHKRKLGESVALMLSCDDAIDSKPCPASRCAGQSECTPDDIHNFIQRHLLLADGKDAADDAETGRCCVATILCAIVSQHASAAARTGAFFASTAKLSPITADNEFF